MALSSFLRKLPVEFERRRGGAAVTADVYPLPGRRVLSMAEALPSLSREIERARRYSRPFAVVLLSVDVSVDLLDARADLETLDGHAILRVDVAQPGQDLSPIVSALLAQLARELLRESDIVTLAASEARCLVGLPETTSEGARASLDRIRRAPAILTLPPLRCGVAAFPEDGWTLADLVAKAEGAWLAAPVFDLPGADSHAQLRDGEAS